MPCIVKISEIYKIKSNWFILILSNKMIKKKYKLVQMSTLIIINYNL